MRGFHFLLVLTLVAGVAAQSSDPPLTDSRLTVNTLLREDIFAGWMDNDMDRFSRGERNIEVLIKLRPEQRASLLAWKGGAAVYRAVLAHEGGKPEEAERYLQQSREAFEEAENLKSPTGVSVPAIVGGSMVVFADRLPEQHRAKGWAQAYGAYSELWRLQESTLDKLPVHHRGEVLGGLAQSAYRTGRVEEADHAGHRLLASLAGTSYEAAAKEWRAKPSTTALTCKGCHAPGRLSARLGALAQ